MAAQEVLATAQCKTLLGERYLRIAREPAENQVPAIRDFDRATTQARRPCKVSQTNPGMNIKETRVFAAFSAESDFTWRGQILELKTVTLIAEYATTTVTQRADGKQPPSSAGAERHQQ